MNFKCIASQFLITMGLFGLTPQAAHGELNVLTTTSNLYHVTKEIGGSEIEVDLMCPPQFDPHFLEAKPSLVLAASQADLLVAIGLDLEIGWLPKVIANSRNPKINPGQAGYLEVGALVNPIERATGQVTREAGDVHPEGNPHVTLDPIRLGTIAIHIGERLGTLDPAHKNLFAARASGIKERLESQVTLWNKTIAESGTKAVISYHKSFSYFFERFNLKNPMVLEPIPGVPPTAKHMLDVITTAKSQGIRVVLVENYFDPTPAKKIARDIPGIAIVHAPVEVGSVEGVTSIDQLFAFLVKAVSP